MRFFSSFVLALSLAFLMGTKPYEYNEVLVSYFIEKMDPKLDTIAENFEIVRRMNKNNKEGFEVYVLSGKNREFLKLSPNAVPITNDRSLLPEPLEVQYTDFKAVESFLEEMAKKYPEITDLQIYGKSQQGLPLYVLKISDKLKDDEKEPELMITSATHGDELITVEASLYSIKWLLESYADDPNVQSYINDHEIYFIPVVNPDGFVKQHRYDNGLDPNRDYPYPDKPHKETKTASIKQLIAFFHSRDFEASLDIHAYGQMVMYPWAYTRDPLNYRADIGLFDKVTEQMANKFNYKFGQISEVIYIAKGSSSDYYYWKTGTYALAVEIGRSKVPRSLGEYNNSIQESHNLIIEFLKYF